MKILFFLAILVIPLSVNAQDLIILKNGTTVNCKITKMDSLNIYFNFRRNNTGLTSFINKEEVKSYTQSIEPNLNRTGIDRQFLHDTATYIKEDNKWNNIITYSGKYSLVASGWSLQYYGYTIKKDKYWIVPCIVEFEKLLLKEEYFDVYNYKSAKLSYMMAGISPLRRLNDNFYLSLGFRLAIGVEQLNKYNRYSEQLINNFIFGAQITEGIYFIPKSNFGLVCGFGFFEKAFYSKAYPQDLGFKWELGFKF